MHEDFFGSTTLDGKDYVKFIFDNVDFIGFDREHNSGALAYLHKESIYLTTSFFQLYGKIENLELLSVLLHEARHTHEKYKEHVQCPDSFNDVNNKPLKSKYSGVELSSRMACDKGIDSPYALNSIMFFNIAKYCETCTPEVKINLEKRGKQLLNRVLDKESKDKILNDIKS